jgi:hypothetical protein
MNTGCELLPRLLHASADPTLIGELKSLRSEDWDDLLQQAEHHQVTPLLHRALEERHTALPADVRERLDLSCFSTAVSNAELFSQLTAVLATLKAEGIPVLVLKGAHLAEIVYRDVTLRPMGDVDLLVRRSDLLSAERVLLGLGYRPQIVPGGIQDYSAHRHLPPFIKDGAVPIEIHRLIDESGCFQIDAEGLWERARTAWIARVEALVLSPEDLLLHLCLHAAFQHGFRVPLRHIYDIVATIQHHGPELDWRGLVRAAETSGLSRICYYALAVAESLLGAGVPAEALTALETSGCDPRMVAVIREYVLLHPTHPAPGGIQEMFQTRGWLEGMRSLLRSLFPSPARLREMYALAPGSKAVYGYYLIRPWDLFLRRGRFLAQLASRGSAARIALDTEAKGRLIRRQLEVEPLRPEEAQGR